MQSLPTGHSKRLNWRNLSLLSVVAFEYLFRRPFAYPRALPPPHCNPVASAPGKSAIHDHTAINHCPVSAAGGYTARAGKIYNDINCQHLAQFSDRSSRSHRCNRDDEFPSKASNRPIIPPVVRWGQMGKCTTGHDGWHSLTVP